MIFVSLVVQVKSSDNSLVTVGERVFGSSYDPVSTGEVVAYPIELQVAVMMWKGAQDIIDIEIKSPLSGQVEIVSVHIMKGHHAGEIFPSCSILHSKGMSF